MRTYTSTYCNSTGHLIAIKNGTFNDSRSNIVVFHGEFYKFLGIRENEKCLVKIPRSCSWNQTDCQFILKKFEEVKKWTKLGSKYLNFDVSVHVPTMVQLRKVSSWFRKKVGRDVTEGDLVLVEELIDGVCEEFVDRDGHAHSTTRQHALHELIHYIYHKSEGQLVICGFQGVFDGKLIHFTETTIHSESGVFGASDEGPAGIRRVFQNHTCTDRCRNWKLPHVLKTKESVPGPSLYSSQTDVKFIRRDQELNNHPDTTSCRHAHTRLPTLYPKLDPPPPYYPLSLDGNMTPKGYPVIQQSHVLDLLWENSPRLRPTAPPSYEL